MDQSPFFPQSFIVYDDDLFNAKRQTGAICLTDVRPARAPWLWPGRIPLGSVTLLVSDPGLGKSLLALDIAARVSTAKPWPESKHGAASKEQGDESSGPNSLLPAPGAVLLINIEDHFQNTIRPRLDALSADCSRIFGWTYVRGEQFFEQPHLFALGRDLIPLEKLIAAMADCRLVILDPISAFLGDQSNGDVGKLLSALATLASKHNFAVLIVSHLRKQAGAAIHRALGSLAFVAAARAVWTIAKDPADPNKRLLLPLKNNLAPDAKGLAFTIATDETTRAPVIRWLPDVVEASADTMLAPNRFVGRPDDERKYAVQWLRARLSDGASPVRDIRNDALAHGIGYGTLRRAFRELGAKAVKQGEVKYGQWTWKLPGQDAQNTVGEFCAPSQRPDEFAFPMPAAVSSPKRPPTASAAASSYARN